MYFKIICLTIFHVLHTSPKATPAPTANASSQTHNRLKSEPRSPPTSIRRRQGESPIPIRPCPPNHRVPNCREARSPNLDE